MHGKCRKEVDMLFQNFKVRNNEIEIDSQFETRSFLSLEGLFLDFSRSGNQL